MKIQLINYHSRRSGITLLMISVEGIVPVKRLSWMSSLFNRGIELDNNWCISVEGDGKRVPLNLFFEKLTSRRNSHLSVKVNGIAPSKALSLRYKKLIIDNPVGLQNISFGMVPVNSFPANWRNWSFVRLDNVSGIEPRIRLSLILSSLRWLRPPMSLGIEPVRPYLSMVSCVYDITNRMWNIVSSNKRNSKLLE